MQDESLTAEQRAHIDSFLADSRTVRFVECDDNWTAIGNFLDHHGLEVNHRNLLFAYDSLQDTLELIPFAEPIVVPQPEPTPVAMPSGPVVPTPAPSKRPFIMWRNGKPISGGARSV
jgi:hypothetical protein